ncbi:MAG: hypothetical protein AAFN11_04105 [Chloroflexota bacterium]
MRRLSLLIVLMLMLIAVPTGAQDGLNLPSELYVLNAEGVVQRFGLGTEGVSAVTPEDAFVLDFGIAPDANWIAYRTQDGMFMRHMFDDSIETRQIEDDRASLPVFRGRGETVVWAQDSTALAYTTEYGGRVHFFVQNTFVDIENPNLLNLIWSPDGGFLVAEAEDNVWWIYQRNGTEMILRAAIPGANGGVWMNETQFLHAPLEGGLTILDLSAGNAQIQVLANTDSYFEPSVTRDGQVVAFTGELTAATLNQITLDETLVGSATAIGSAPVDLTGVRWAVGGFLLGTLRSGVIALVNPVNANGFTLPVSSVGAYSWGPAYPPLVANVLLPNRVTFLARDLGGVQQVWQLPTDGSRAETISPATLDVTDYAISPNGQRLAYVSNSMLWTFTLGSDAEPTELVMLGINMGIALAWGPDNATLYYRDAQGDETGIWRVNVDAETAAPELFLPDSNSTVYNAPNPAGGVGAMLVQTESELALVDTTSAAVTALPIVGNADWQSGTTFIASGEALGDEVDGDGVYLFDANQPDTPPTLVLPFTGSLELLDYQVLADGRIRVLVRNQAPGTIRILDAQLDGSQPTVVGNAGYMVNPQVSPDGTLVIGQRTETGALLVHTVETGVTQQIDVGASIMGVKW